MGVWDVATPAGSDPISQGDDRIRELKVAVQEALRGGAAEGDEAVFPGSAPTTAPIFRYRGLKGSTAARPAAAVGGLYYNTTTGTLQRSNGTSWDDVAVTPGASAVAVHSAPPAALASVAGVVTFPETGNSFNVTGTEAVTSLAGWSAGVVIVKWSSARIITHSANLYLEGALSRNVSAGDISTFEFTGASAAREIAFHGAGSGTETGASILHNGSTAPTGFLAEDGASYLRADYPRLFSRIGTLHGAADGTHFNVPDTLGEFLRMVDSGTGRDPDAATRTASKPGGATGDSVGTKQGEQFLAHTHVAGRSGGGMQGGGSGGSCTDLTSGSTGGSETRPRNVTKLPCIKY